MSTKQYVRRLAAGFAAMLVAALVLLTAHSAGAQALDPDRRIITVTGEGVVRISPDMANVGFGIVTVADDPETARSENAEASSTAMNAVRELGIEERFIRLETLQLQPHREYDEDLRRYIERGFEASRQIVVQVHDLDDLPTLISTIVQEGANRLNYVSYDLQNRDQARNDALREAALNAREKAGLILETFGLELGELRYVNEQSFDFPRPYFRMESMQAMARDSAPEPDAYAAGELEVRANLNVTFEVGE